LFFSLAALPLTASLLINYSVLFARCSTISVNMILAAAGFILFLGAFFLFGPPVKSYVFEHELSHIIFALFSGVRVKSVSFRKNGHVKTEKVNIFIALAPYAFPLYTLLCIGVFKLIRLKSQNPVLSYPFYFFFGLTLSFHIIATVHYVQIDQPDLSRYGYFSSLVIIFTWSLLVIALMLALMFDNIAVMDFFRDALETSGEIYTTLFSFTRKLFLHL
jgi:hypothetical protein